jgi:hypothetical protein
MGRIEAAMAGNHGPYLKCRQRSKDDVKSIQWKFSTRRLKLAKAWHIVSLGVTRTP